MLRPSFGCVPSPPQGEHSLHTLAAAAPTTTQTLTLTLTPTLAPTLAQALAQALAQELVLAFTLATRCRATAARKTRASQEGTRC